jgi:hypothetical protein
VELILGRQVPVGVAATSVGACRARRVVGARAVLGDDPVRVRRAGPEGGARPRRGRVPVVGVPIGSPSRRSGRRWRRSVRAPLRPRSRGLRAGGWRHDAAPVDTADREVRRHRRRGSPTRGDRDRGDREARDEGAAPIRHVGPSASVSRASRE